MSVRSCDGCTLCTEKKCCYINNVIPVPHPNQCGYAVFVEKNLTYFFYKIEQNVNYVDQNSLNQTIQMLKQADLPVVVNNLERLSFFDAFNLFYLELDDESRLKILKNLGSYITKPNEVLILANYLERIGRSEESIDLCEYSIQYFPELNTQQMFKNLVSLCSDAMQIDKIEKYNTILKKYDSSNPDTCLNDGVIEFFKNNKQKAKQIYLELSLREDLDKRQRLSVEFNLNWYNYFDENKYMDAIRNYIDLGTTIGEMNPANISNQRFSLWWKRNISKELPISMWDGNFQNIKKLLVFPSGGIGDTFINYRFMKQVSEKNIEVVYADVSNQKIDTNLFQKDNITTLHSYQSINEYVYNNHDSGLYFVDTMYLAPTLEQNPNNLWKGKYIYSDEKYLNKWKEKTKTNKKIKIGLRWQGNTLYKNNLGRTIPIKEVYEKLKHLDAEFYSLQKDAGVEEAKSIPEIKDFSEELQTWDDTFALIDSMDLVISSCTSVAHAAAALDKETYVFSPINTYYTWIHPSNIKSYWYGENVNAFHQQKPQNWDEPISEMVEMINDKYNS